MLVDCDICDARPAACGDCVIGVLLGPPSEAGLPIVQLDAPERRALDVLADQGLVPRLQLVERASASEPGGADDVAVERAS